MSVISRSLTTCLAASVIVLVSLNRSDSAARGTRPQLDSSHRSEQSNKAQRLFEQAIAACSTNHLESVRKSLFEATAIWVREGQSDQAARADIQVGDCYKANAEFKLAMSFYNTAMETKPLAPLVKATALDAIAQVYGALYQFDLALDEVNKALNLVPSGQDARLRSHLLLDKAGLSYQNGNLEAAKSCIEEVVQLSHTVGNETAQADALWLLGRINTEQGQLDGAKVALEKALGISRKIKDPWSELRVLPNLARVSLLSGQRERALDLSQQAVKLVSVLRPQAISYADKVRLKELSWPAWLSSARAQRALGLKKGAEDSYYFVTYFMTEVWLNSYRFTDLSSVAFAEEQQAPFREFVDFLVEEGRIPEAYDVFQKARGRTLAASIQARHLGGFSKAGVSKDRAQTANNETLLRVIRETQSRLLSNTLSYSEKAKLEKSLAEAREELAQDRVQAELDQSADWKKWSRPIDMDSLRTRLLAPDQSLLEFCLGEKRSFVWLISKNDVSFEILPGRAEIEQEVTQYLKLISTPPKPWRIEEELSKQRAAARRLLSLLLGNIAGRLGASQRLIVVPDGMLNYLPFESLISDDRCLIEDHEISYLPSANLLDVTPEAGAAERPRGSNKMELLAFGCQNFNTRAGSFEGHHSRSAGLGDRRLDLPALPMTRDEVQYIASLFPGKANVYQGKNATEAAFKTLTLSRYRRIHFATHCLIDDKHPSQSAIVLTPTTDGAEDGLLDVSEISDLDLDCDLVVLSACETGHGQLLSGEGIMGLSRAFLSAGARSVVVSQWDVSDISTANLMKDFYQGLIKNDGTAGALRAAKLHMLHGTDKTRLPYYWAPFIIVGKP